MKLSIGFCILFLAAMSVAAAPNSRSISPRTFDVGRASWYGYEWTTGKRGTMANGKRFNPQAISAASYNYPLGTVLEVTNVDNGRRIIAPVTDRGPAKRLNRLLDLSEAGATALGYHRAGIATVVVRVLAQPHSMNKEN
jgi:rare lipoprotein A